jgi:hypothetical protein
VRELFKGSHTAKRLELIELLAVFDVELLLLVSFGNGFLFCLLNDDLGTESLCIELGF